MIVDGKCFFFQEKMKSMALQYFAGGKNDRGRDRCSSYAFGEINDVCGDLNVSNGPLLTLNL